MKSGSIVGFCLWFVLLTGCAGFRGGSFSAPYIGETEPALRKPTTPFERMELQKLTLPGLKVELSLNTLRRDYDFGVILFVVPIYFESGDFPENRPDRPFEITLTLAPSVAGYRLDTSKALVIIDGKSHAPVGAHEISTAVSLDETQTPKVVTIRFNIPVPGLDARISLDLSQALIHDALPRVPLIRFKTLKWSAGYT